ncbi:MAG: DUF1634 domain-containing protein [Desulfobaccales bacterium]|jgi:uncharacterized membrane protein
MRYPKAWTDQQMDIIIGVILRTGVIISALVVLLGGVIYLHHFAYNKPLYRVFLGEPSDLRHITGIIRDAMAFKGRGIIQFGLLLLIATPVVRVAFSIVAFALQRDRLYVMVTLIVLGILLFSLIGGR